MNHRGNGVIRWPIAILIALLAAALAFRAASARSPLTVAEAPAGTPDASGAKADEIARGFFGKRPAGSKAFACFERIYDAAHLGRHALQKVGSMVVLVSGEMVAEDPIVNYAVALGMSYKNSPARYVSAAYCGHASAGPGLHCGVDCEGGSFDVALAGDGRSALVSLERIAIWPEKARAGDDPERRGTLDAGADDKSFRLQRVPLSRCLSLANDKEDAAEIKRAD